MSTKLLYVLSGVVAIMAAFLYFYRANTASDQSQSNNQFDFWANDVIAIQTDENGREQLQLTTRRLSHEMSTGILYLNDINASVKHFDDAMIDDHGTSAKMLQSHFEFTAAKAMWRQKDDALIMTGGVKAKKKPLDSSKKEQFGHVMFSTETLEANTKNKLVYSQSPVVFKTDSGIMKAKRFSGNIATGEYQFDAMQAYYNNP